MFTWVENLYPYCIEYETVVYGILKSGEKPTGWHDFILDIFSQIATGMFEDAADEIPGAGAAIAIAGDNIKTWVTGNVPGNLDATYIEFVNGHLKMQTAITDFLLKLADKGKPEDPGYPYQNLKEGFKEDITFNNKTYSLSDLATSQFPSDANGEDFVALRAAAFKKFKQHMWNVMLIKTGAMYHNYENWYISCDHDVICPIPDQKPPSKYATEEFYNDPRYKATYLRGFYSSDVYHFLYWYFEVDGAELSVQAANELFQDDYPGHIINPEGLFLRDYVFKQFHREKPDFTDQYEGHYYELPSNADAPCCSNQDFNQDADNYVFSGGDFKMLTTG